MDRNGRLGEEYIRGVVKQVRERKRLEGSLVD